MTPGRQITLLEMIEDVEKELINEESMDDDSDEE